MLNYTKFIKRISVSIQLIKLNMNMNAIMTKQTNNKKLM